MTPQEQLSTRDIIKEAQDENAKLKEELPAAAAAPSFFRSGGDTCARRELAAIIVDLKRDFFGSPFLFGSAGWK